MVTGPWAPTSSLHLALFRLKTISLHIFCILSPFLQKGSQLTIRYNMLLKQIWSPMSDASISYYTLMASARKFHHKYKSISHPGCSLSPLRREEAVTRDNGTRALCQSAVRLQTSSVLQSGLTIFTTFSISFIYYKWACNHNLIN